MWKVSCMAIAMALAACQLGDAAITPEDDTLDDWLAGQQNDDPEDEPGEPPARRTARALQTPPP